MRKTTKGALALGAGIALLLGGAGTFALWNDEAALGSQATVTTGDLDITTVGNGTWAWAGGGAFNPASDRLVPGDSVTFTRSFNVLATGNHLAADIAISGGALDAGVLTATRVVNTPAGVTGNGPYSFAKSDSATPRNFAFEVTYTITFPSTADSGKNTAVSLADTNVTVTQVTS